MINYLITTGVVREYDSEHCAYTVSTNDGHDLYVVKHAFGVVDNLGSGHVGIIENNTEVVLLIWRNGDVVIRSAILGSFRTSDKIIDSVTGKENPNEQGTIGFCLKNGSHVIIHPDGYLELGVSPECVLEFYPIDATMRALVNNLMLYRDTGDYFQWEYSDRDGTGNLAKNSLLHLKMSGKDSALAVVPFWELFIGYLTGQKFADDNPAPDGDGIASAIRLGPDKVIEYQCNKDNFLLIRFKSGTDTVEIKFPTSTDPTIMEINSCSKGTIIKVDKDGEIEASKGNAGIKTSGNNTTVFGDTVRIGQDANKKIATVDYVNNLINAIKTALNSLTPICVAPGSPSIPNPANTAALEASLSALQKSEAAKLTHLVKEL